MRSLVKNVATLVGTIGISAGAVALPDNISILAPLTPPAYSAAMLGFVLPLTAVTLLVLLVRAAETKP